MQQDLTKLTLQEALKGLKARSFSAVELMQTFLKRIKEQDKNLNSYITLINEEKLLQQAQNADQQIAKGKYNELTGIPIALKDNWLLKDVRTTAGSKVLDNFIAPYSATATQKLLDKGAIVIGKLNMDAWAHGSSGENSDYGPTKNPWHLDYVPGGSSSGPASAVAARLAMLATGTDTGGSIRLPAAFTGTVGIKPTYGRVSRYGIVAMASSTDSIGHLTKTVWDNAYILSITAGHDRYDATTSDIEVPKYYEDLDSLDVKQLKIGVIEEFQSGIDAQIQQNLDKVLKNLEQKGATIKKVSINDIKRGIELYYILMSAEVSSNLARYDGIRYGDNRKSMGEEAKRRIMLGTYVLSDVIPGKGLETTYAKVGQARTKLINELNKVFKEVDVLIAPVAPSLPFKLGEKTNDPLKMYMSDLLTVPFSIAGVPGLTVPTGTAQNDNGVTLPVGVQIIGPNFSEHLLYKVGKLIETPEILNMID